MPSATHAVALVPHPATPSAAVQSVVVQVRRAPRDRELSLRYVLTGDLGRLRIATPRPAARVDGLWRHTCFELFVAADGPAYREFNFSPSGEWAAYAFTAYRASGSPLDCTPPEMHCERADRTLVLEARLAGVAEGTLRLGLCAVLEDSAGSLGYWALRHAAARPDFHDRTSFTLALDEARD
jgi:hypothetical protein